MSIEQYKELSLQEQIPIPSSFLGRLYFNFSTVVTVFYKDIKTPLEIQLLNDDDTFTTELTKKYAKFDEYEGFGNIYNLHVPAVNKKGNPSILFIHGLGGNFQQFDEVIKEFHSNYDIYAFDLPGSGKSQEINPDLQLSLNNFTKFVLKFIEANKLGDLILVGHSYGTQIILKLINNLQEGQVKKVVLIAPPKFPSRKTPLQRIIFKTFKTFPILFEIFRKFDRINNINSTSLNRLFGHNDEIEDYIKFKQFRFNLSTHTNNFLSYVVHWKPITLEEVIGANNILGQDKHKLLIIDGEKDQVTHQGGQTYKELLGDGSVTYKVLENAGHNLILDSYKVLNKELEQFY